MSQTNKPKIAANNEVSSPESSQISVGLRLVYRTAPAILSTSEPDVNSKQPVRGCLPILQQDVHNTGGEDNDSEQAEEQFHARIPLQCIASEVVLPAEGGVIVE